MKPSVIDVSILATTYRMSIHEQYATVTFEYGF